MEGKKPELLAPAGDEEKLKMALLYGADAVYLGGPAYGLRALGGNFSRDGLRSAVAMAHRQGKKAYVTVNVYPHNEELADLPGYLRHLAEIAADAILVSDLGVFSVARDVVPTLPVHISTQANTVNWAAAEAWRKLGAARVVLAREMSREEILDVRRKTAVELEMFVHGAMCISYSGRCLISSYLTGRDANRGSCAQPCRWRYHLVEEERPGQIFPVEEDDHGTYFFNSKDLCLLPHLSEVMESGVDSLKIEGRMKSVHYVASVVKTYRAAIDAYFRAPKHFFVRPAWLEELEKVSHRAYTAGFFLGATGAADQIYGTASYQQTSVFVGVVEGYEPMSGWAAVEQRNHIKAGEEIEVLSPHGDPFRQSIEEMRDDAGAVIASAPHAQQKIQIKMKQPVMVGSILRRPR
ncbi:MAG: peptidase U32 family protein [Schwartzia sp. (in: firmicutes)]